MLLSIYPPTLGEGPGWDTFIITPRNMHCALAGKTPPQLETLFREGCSTGTLRAVQTWALINGDHDMVALINTILQKNLRTYTVVFPYDGTIGNQAEVTVFTMGGDQLFFHIDYALVTGEKDAILHLHRNEWGDWESPSDLGDPMVYQVIGKAIALAEGMPALVKQAGEQPLNAEGGAESVK